MTARIIDGEAVATGIREQLAATVKEIEEQYGFRPGLATVLVGENPASQQYVRMKQNRSKKVGIQSYGNILPAESSQEEVEGLVRHLGEDPNVHGILVQLPLPDRLDEEAVLNAIPLPKDVDGFHPVNIGRLAMKGRKPLFIPCTPAGVIRLLEEAGAVFEGAEAVVLGRSNIVGMPAAMLMASLQGSLRTLISAGFRGKELIEKLNSYLCENTPDNRLVTLFYGELDTSTGALRYVNAGHNAPLWLQEKGDLQSLDSTAMALGITEGPQIHDSSIQLQPNDQILLYTDGLSEAFNRKMEPFGEVRLSQRLLHHQDLPAPSLIQSIVKDVLGFTGSTKQGDDMTLMVIRRTCPQPSLPVDN